MTVSLLPRRLADIAWPAEPARIAARDRADMHRGMYSAVRAVVRGAITRTVRTMLADQRELDRVEPGLSALSGSQIYAHCRWLWRGVQRSRRRRDPIAGDVAVINLRAARIAAYVMARRERAQRRTAA